MARRTKIPREYANDMRRAARGFKGAATVARRVGYDAASMRELRKVAARNNALNWASDGAAMGDRWRGERAGNTVLDDAVDTGKLREHATTPWLLKPRVSARVIRFNVPKSRVPYIRFVGAQVMGWTPWGRRELVATVQNELVAVATRKRAP